MNVLMTVFGKICLCCGIALMGISSLCVPVHAPLWADDVELGMPITQCPGEQDIHGNYLGCKNPGGPCVFGQKRSTCGNAPGGNDCTCLPV